MKILFTVLFIISLFISVLIPGCSTTSSDPGPVSLKGVVLDTTTSPYTKIQGALVTLVQSGTTLTTSTDSIGAFLFESLSTGEAQVTISKYNYYRYNKPVYVSGDSVTLVTISLLPKYIYVYNNIVLDEYKSTTSFSAANFLSGQRVQETTSNKDVQIRDTVVGPDTLIYLRSAFLDVITRGNETHFSSSLIPTYTKAQFDTISKFPTEDNYLDPGRDFTFHNGMDRFLNYGVQHSVCAFYLAGRWIGDPFPRTFGLLYIDSVWYDASQNLRKILVDIKINTNAVNDFNPNPSK